MRLGSSLAPSGPSLWETIAVEAGRESELWAAALRPEPEREEEAVFSPLAEERFAVGLETIYEGYLLHYGKPRLFRADDRDTRILLGDYLYAHGLVRVASLGDVEAVGALAELLSLCAHLRAQGLPGDGEVWAATVASLNGGAEGSDAARGRALALHAERVE
jgi:hypothetical protein